MSDYLKIWNSKQKYFMYPFFIISLYISITLMLNLFGPIEYQYYTVGRKIAVTIYIFLFLIVTYIGMKVAAMTSGVDAKQLHRNFIRVKNFITIIEIIIFFVFIEKFMLLGYQIFKYGMQVTNVSFASLAEVYSNLHAEDTAFNLFRKIDSFTRVLMFLAFFSGVYLWKKIRYGAKCLLCIAIICDVFYNLLYIGTQRSVFTYMVLLGMLYIVHIVKRKKGIRKRNIVIVLIAVLVVALIFIKMIGARYALWGSTMNLGFKKGMRYDPNHLLVRWLSGGEKYAFMTFLSYPTQGYYGLAMCFGMPFQWTWLLGGVRGLNSIVSQILPQIPDFLELSYPVRVGKIIGFDGLASWYTIFPWLASDLTFVGALIVMVIVAYLFMECWKEVILYNNPLSFGMLIQLTLLYIFVPANNQLFIERGNSLGMVFLTIIWLVFHKRLNYCEEAIES